MRLIRHPFVDQDLIGIAQHIVTTTKEDIAAAYRRLDEIDALLQAIAENPQSGYRLSAPLDGWLVRHGGAGRRLTIVFKPDFEQDVLYIALVAFGGSDWIRRTEQRGTPTSDAF